MKLIGLIRVSTGKQGESGLGLEAQEAAIEEYRKRNDGILIKTYKEIESGTHDSIEDRPELRAAVAHARRSGATLVIAKIDRLVRSTVIGAYLKTSGVKFVACDNPYANELTIDILVAVAADEARRISTRTKEALAAYKSHGRVSKRIKLMYPDGVPAAIAEATSGKLGASLPQCRNLTHEGRNKGLARSASVRRAKAVEAYADLAEYMQELRSESLTLLAIAEKLNEDGHTTRRGKPWNPTQVMRVLGRLSPQRAAPPPRPDARPSASTEFQRATVQSSEHLACE
jgi:DNA invertase Pin-like site-specific DNA recombinase